MTSDHRPVSPSSEGRRPFFARLPNPIGWSLADRCGLVVAIYLFFELWAVLSYVYFTRNPAAAPYLDRDFLAWDLRLRGVEVVVWTVVGLFALAVRRRKPSSVTLLCVTVFLAVLTLVHGAYVYGTHTTLYTGAAVCGSVAIGSVLFPRWIMRLAVPFLLCLVAGITAAELSGVLPYAPLLVESPFTGGRLSAGWMIGSGGIALLILLVAVGLTYDVVYQWHDRERQLAESSDQLSRANDIISRYVASQLVSQVRSGQYEALDRRERRKLTLFFSDIEDFAATADLTEPEDLAAVLNEYLAEMTAIGKRHGATIDKFVGDAIMIFFGAPVATSDQDHALRAVRMAAEMQDRMTELQAKWRRQGFERPFRIRIGINTGHVNIGNFGSAERMDYTAIGRQVNLAARLQTHCEPGKILISHSTWVLVQDEVACAPQAEIQAKGFHQPVKVYVVIGPLTNPGSP